MIKVHVIKKNGEFKEVHVSGHAGFGKAGEDVVCAAVSMLVINTINAIDFFTPDKDRMEVKSDEEKGAIDLNFLYHPSKESKLLLDTMILGITETEKNYGKKYVSFTLEEV